MLKESDSDRPIVPPTSVMGDRTTVLLSFEQENKLEKDFEFVEDSDGDTKKNDVNTDHVHDNSKDEVNFCMDGADQFDLVMCDCLVAFS